MGKIILILTLVLFVSGCVLLPIPHDECEQPEINGVVLNRNNDPINNVGVEIKIEQIDLVLNGETNSDGEFQIESKCKNEFWYFVAMDPNIAEIRLKLSHDGYYEKELTRRFKYKKTKAINFGNIILKNR
jgi:hypothetical protein